MKTRIMLLSVITVMLISCSSIKTTKSPTNIPCKGKEIVSDDEFFRVTASSESIDEQGSIDKADAICKLRMINDILARIKVGVKYYAEDMTDKKLDKKKEEIYEFANKLEEELISSTDVFICGITTVCQETYKKRNGAYKTFVTKQYLKKDFYNPLGKIAKELGYKYQIDIDEENFSKKMKGEYNEFKQEYEKELERLNQQN